MLHTLALTNFWEGPRLKNLRINWSGNIIFLIWTRVKAISNICKNFIGQRWAIAIRTLFASCTLMLLFLKAQIRMVWRQRCDRPCCISHIIIARLIILNTNGLARDHKLISSPGERDWLRCLLLNYWHLPNVAFTNETGTNTIWQKLLLRSIFWLDWSILPLEETWLGEGWCKVILFCISKESHCIELLGKQFLVRVLNLRITMIRLWVIVSTHI